MRRSDLFLLICKKYFMKTVLVPVDFSDTSLNAAAYAVKLLTGLYGVNMLLYHVYERPEHAAAAEQELKKLKAKLFDIGIVKMQTHCEEGHDFATHLERYVRENKTDLVIMGITGRNKMEQTFIGSNTLKIIQKNLCPVLIVPPEAKFGRLKNLALTSDFLNEPPSATMAFIKNILSSFFAKLHIVNVDPAHHVSITEAYQQLKTRLEGQFKGFEREFHFIGLFNFPETMNLFVNDHDIDMIVTMPKDHSWLNVLLGNSNTKKLAYQSHVAVLAIHQ
jgi:nucleotide-binding universal stress UspA family protein